jgi:hypothetical protein
MIHCARKGPATGEGITDGFAGLWRRFGCGASIQRRHTGHSPRSPPKRSGTVNAVPHPSQLNRITSFFRVAVPVFKIQQLPLKSES